MVIWAFGMFRRRLRYPRSWQINIIIIILIIIIIIIIIIIVAILAVIAIVTVIMAQSPACLMDAGILPDSFSSGWFRLRAGPESVLFEHWQPGPWPVGCGNVPIVHSWSSSAQCHGGGLKRSKPASLAAGPGASS